MNKLMTTLALVAALAATGCATKSRSFDASGMYMSDTGQLAVGKIHVDAIPEGQESAVIHYSEDTALLSPSTKTHDIDVILTGTNSVTNASTIVTSICEAFVAVAPKLAETNAKTPKGITALDVAQSNASANAAVKKTKAMGERASSPASTEETEKTADADCPECTDSTDCPECTVDCPDGKCAD